MSQNSIGIAWDRDEVDHKLQQIMRDIHTKCVDAHDGGRGIDYARAANVAAFCKIADAMMAYGVV